MSRQLASVALTLMAFVAWASPTCAAEGHSQRAAGSFDRNQALGISQAALGRTVIDQTLIRRNGTPIRLADYRGKPLVVSLVFTSCAHVCPATTRHLHRAVEQAWRALGDDSFRVVTIGFDTTRDTPETMAVFARQHGVDAPGWDFLATDPETIERLAIDLGFVYYPAGGGFDHLIQSTLIDADGVVHRQIYGIDFPIPHLVEPLKALVFGVQGPQSLFESLANRVLLFCTVYDPASDSYKFSYDIFIGLAVGLTLGILAMVAVMREWRHHRTAEGHR